MANPFVGFQFNESWDSNMSGIRKSWASNDAGSIHSASSRNVLISKTVWEGLHAWAGNDPNTTIARDTDGTIWVERRNPTTGSVQIVCRNRNNGSAGMIRNADGSVETYKVRTTLEQGVNGTAFVTSMIPETIDDSEARDIYLDVFPLLAYDENYNWSDAELTSLSRDITRFGDNMYRRTGRNCKPTTDLYAYYPKDNTDIGFMTSAPTEELDLIAGTAATSILKIAQPKTQSGATGTKKANKAKKSASAPVLEITYPAGTYTPDEEAEIPVMDATYIHPEWAKEMVSKLVFTRRYKEAFVNAALFGPAGNGKSTACKGSAAEMGMPFDIFSCDPDTTLEQMFGGTRININKTSQDDPEFVFVEGVVSKALRLGHFLEIQEVGLVRRPGVMAALNAIMEAGPGKYLTLETGQRIYRDPKAVVVFTSNDGYNGTQLFNQSVLSRCAFVKYFENPTVEEMLKRTLLAVPDFSDVDMLKGMAKTVADLSNYLRENEIDTGVCGQRELTNWAMAAMYESFISGEPLSKPLVRKAAQATLVEKASQHREEIEEITDAIVNRDWGILEF